jgi:hypothetical protein
MSARVEEWTSGAALLHLKPLERLKQLKHTAGRQKRRKHSSSAVVSRLQSALITNGHRGRSATRRRAPS